MARTRVKLDLKGFRAYRRDPTVKAVLDEQARAWAARANGARPVSYTHLTLPTNYPV